MREGVCLSVSLLTYLFWVCNYQCFTLFVNGIDYSICVYVLIYACVCVCVWDWCGLVVFGSDCGMYF